MSNNKIQGIKIKCLYTNTIQKNTTLIKALQIIKLNIQILK